NLLTLQMGSDVLLAVKARMVRQPDDLALVASINELEVRLRAAFPAVRWCFFEPDVAD
ncbi:MAG: cation efflux family transporter, partial [Gammaproteobacteria bacterium]|nr:cation efflux family transporter [Gammaproteobacteria bacterium]